MSDEPTNYPTSPRSREIEEGKDDFYDRLLKLSDVLEKDVHDVRRVGSLLIKIGLGTLAVGVLLRLAERVLPKLSQSQRTEKPGEIDLLSIAHADDLLFVTLMIVGGLLVAGGALVQSIMVWRHQTLLIEREVADEVNKRSAQAREEKRLNQN